MFSWNIRERGSELHMMQIIAWLACNFLSMHFFDSSSALISKYKINHHQKCLVYLQISYFSAINPFLLQPIFPYLPFLPHQKLRSFAEDYNNQFQSQRKMTSQQVANYLNQLGSNQRKLEYCREILAEHPQFTPHGVFNVNFKTPANTLYRSQFVDLLKRIGLDLAEAEVLKAFEYFQVDGKNYITLQEFSRLMLPQSTNDKKAAQNQRQNKLILDYSLKFSLQKFFKQILENQTKAQQLACFNLEAKQASKLKYKKIDVASVKNFLASHGKYPTDSVIDSIHKEISLIKGSSKRNKSIVDFVLQQNEKKGNIIQKTQGGQNKEGVAQNDGKKIVLNEQKQVKEKALTAKPAAQVGNTLQQRQKVSNKTLCDISSGVINKPIMMTKEPTLKVTNSNIQANNVESRIKTLMESINIKPSIQRSIIKQQKLEEQENIQNEESRITVSSRTDQTFSRVSISQKVSASKAITNRLANMNIFLDEDQDKKELNLPSSLLKKTSSIIEEPPKDITTIMHTRTRTSTFSENRKENSSVLSSCQPTQKAKRLDYLRSLADQDCTKRAVLTFRS